MANSNKLPVRTNLDRLWLGLGSEFHVIAQLLGRLRDAMELDEFDQLVFDFFLTEYHQKIVRL